MIKLSRAEKNVRWIEEHCRTSEGKPVVLSPDDRALIAKLYGTPELAGYITSLHSIGTEALHDA